MLTFFKDDLVGYILNHLGFQTDFEPLESRTT